MKHPVSQNIQVTQRYSPFNINTILHTPDDLSDLRLHVRPSELLAAQKGLCVCVCMCVCVCDVYMDGEVCVVCVRYVYMYEWMNVFIEPVTTHYKQLYNDTPI